MSHAWFIIRTEPRAEYAAAQQLTRDGLEVFLPRVRSPLPRFGHADTPLFPGYLFLRSGTGPGEWPTFRAAHRVVGWVRFDDFIPSIPDEEIADLRLRIDAINGSDGLWTKFKPGDTVRVVSGGFEGLAQVMEEPKSPQGRAKVLLHFMGRLVQAQVPWANMWATQSLPSVAPKAPRRTRGKKRWIKGAAAPATSS